jgi:ubiquinone/menaquinone biosynthesis C-methylase UbiE
MVLNAGCGCGFDVLPTDLNSVEGVGIDISSSNIAKAKKKYKNVNYVVGDITALPFVSGKFDGISSIDVLEHVSDKKKAVEELARVTKKGGFFVGSTTNLWAPVLLLDSKLPQLMKPIVEKFYPGHYDRSSRFTPHGFNDAFVKAGYEIQKFVLMPDRLVDLKILQKSMLLACLTIISRKITKNSSLRYLRELMIMEASRIQTEDNLQPIML